MSSTIDVCGVSEVPAGAGLRVDVAGMELAVFRVDDRYYVIDDQCTHGPGSLSEGFLDGHEIECDFHQGCFDIRTGAVTAPPCMVPVRTHEVVVENGRVLIQTSGVQPADSAPTESIEVPSVAAAESNDALQGIDPQPDLGSLSRKVEVSGAGVVLARNGDTVLRAALRNGMGFPYSCNVGSCGNCRFELVSGVVRHLRSDPPAIGERDRERNRWLGCQAFPESDVVIKVRLDSSQLPPVRPVRRRATLTQVWRVTHDISEFTFSVDGEDDFVPGQYALLSLDGVEGARPYSMSNLPGAGVWSFHVKRVPGGAATRVLFDDLGPGDQIELDGPYGNGYLRPELPGDLVLVAGGSGISPIVSIARAAAMHPSMTDREICVYYGGRTRRDLCGQRELSDLNEFGHRLQYVAAISEPDPTWTDSAGFIHEVVAGREGTDLRHKQVYFAGPPAMAQAMQSMLSDFDVDPARIHYDEFF